MGLDARVMCNCYRDGRTTEPPVPKEQLYVDEEGYLNLRSNELSTELYKWTQTCCEHPGMDCASERIANWAGYRLFQEALECVGWENFPVLEAELPNSNDGLTAPSAAALALRELDYFRTLERIGSNAFLIDSTSGETVFEHVVAYDGIFHFGGRSGVSMGIGQFEFFIRDKATEAEVFRATRFRQTPLQPGSHEGPVEFLDLDTGEKVLCKSGIAGRNVAWPDGRMKNDEGMCRVEYPTDFHVEVRDVRPVDFSYILDALTRIFQASVETGNPVRWC